MVEAREDRALAVHPNRSPALRGHLADPFPQWSQGRSLGWRQKVPGYQYLFLEPIQHLSPRIGCAKTKGKEEKKTFNQRRKTRNTKCREGKTKHRLRTWQIEIGVCVVLFSDHDDFEPIYHGTKLGTGAYRQPQHSANDTGCLRTKTSKLFFSIIFDKKLDSISISLLLYSSFAFQCVVHCGIS